MNAFCLAVALSCGVADDDRSSNGDAANDVAAVRESELTVSLRAGKWSGILGKEIFVRFTNTGTRNTIRILKPLDGSYYCWLMPHYAFSLDDGKGTKFHKRGRCGNFGAPYSDTNWPDDYVIEIAPGKSFEMSALLPYYIPQDGEYMVSFEYVFLPASDKLPVEKYRYPKSLWKGRAKANPIRVNLKAVRPIVG